MSNIKLGIFYMRVLEGIDTCFPFTVNLYMYALNN